MEVLMDIVNLTVIEHCIELRATPEANRMSVEYQLHAFEENGFLTIEVKLKAGQKHNDLFADYIGDIIIDHYNCEVRYSYPSELHYKKPINTVQHNQTNCF